MQIYSTINPTVFLPYQRTWRMRVLVPFLIQSTMFIVNSDCATKRVQCIRKLLKADVIKSVFCPYINCKSFPASVFHVIDALV